MNSRATRGTRSRDRKRQAKNLARRRQLFKRVTWLSGIAVVLIAIVVGGVIYAGSRSAEPELSPITGLQIGSKVGNHLPEFDFRLVDGRTINSAELASADKPVFYFFFATW